MWNPLSPEECGILKGSCLGGCFVGNNAQETQVNRDVKWKALESHGFSFLFMQAKGGFESRAILHVYGIARMLGRTRWTICGGPVVLGIEKE